MSAAVKNFTDEQHAIMKPYLRSINTRDVKTVLFVQAKKLRPFEYTTTGQRYATFKQTHARLLKREMDKYPDDAAKAERQVTDYMRSHYSAWGQTTSGTTVLMVRRSKEAGDVAPNDINKYAIASKKELAFFFSHPKDVEPYLRLVGTPDMLAKTSTGVEVPIVDLRLCADVYLATMSENSPKTQSKESKAESVPKKEKKKKKKKEARQKKSSHTPAAVDSLSGAQLALLPVLNDDKPLDVAFLATPDDAWEWTLEEGNTLDRVATMLYKNPMVQYDHGNSTGIAALLNGARLTGLDLERHARRLLAKPEIQPLALDARLGNTPLENNPLLKSDVVMDEVANLAFALTTEMLLAHSLDAALCDVIERKNGLGEIASED